MSQNALETQPPATNGEAVQNDFDRFIAGTLSPMIVAGFDGFMIRANRACELLAGFALRILVAEDNPINQLLAVRILEKAGHSVAAADNGEEVLSALVREAFDLVLMDVQMPVMDGFEATALIRQQEKGTGRHLTIVAMTAHAMKGDREKCLEAGMDGYVAKPIRNDDLFAAIAAATASQVQPRGGSTRSSSDELLSKQKSQT